MAPEQIQAGIDACNLGAEAGEAYLRTLSHGQSGNDSSKQGGLLRDGIAICRVTALSLERVSEGAQVCCDACARLCQLCAHACGTDESEQASQAERAFRHCADECSRLAAGLPQASYWA